MNTPEKKLGEYVKEKGINLSKMARDTGIPYMSLYDSMINPKRDRQLRVSEFFDICKFLGVSPLDFSGDN